MSQDTSKTLWFSPVAHLKTMCIMVLKMVPPIKKWKVKITVPGNMMAPAKHFDALSVTQKNHGDFEGTVLEKEKLPKVWCQFIFSWFYAFQVVF